MTGELMICPFPGMDPYVERPEIWPDFHDRLITYLCAALKPLLQPRYVALTQDRLYVVEAERPIRPDISVVAVRDVRMMASDDKDITLDLQAVFTRCRDEGPYPEVLHYSGRPPGKMTDAEAAWCAEVLQKSGLGSGVNE